MVGLSLVCGAVYLVISLTLSARQDDTLVKKRIAVQRLLKEGQEVHDIPGIKHLMSDFLAGHDDLSLVVRQENRAAVFEKDDPLDVWREAHAGGFRALVDVNDGPADRDGGRGVALGVGR